MIDDVGLETARLLDRLRDRAGLGDDLESLAPVEQGDETLADDLVVVDDEESRSGRAGAGSVTVVRSPGLRGAVAR